MSFYPFGGVQDTVRALNISHMRLSFEDGENGKQRLSVGFNTDEESDKTTQIPIVVYFVLKLRYHYLIGYQGYSSPGINKITIPWYKYK